MELLVSISKWGQRKEDKSMIKGGLYLINFEEKKILNRLEIQISSDAARVLGGIAIDGDKIYAAHPKNSKEDSILIIDAKNYSIIEERVFDELYDVHQIDIYEGMLWVTNSNYNEVVAISLDNLEIIGKWCIDKMQPQEKFLKAKTKKTIDMDYRARIHLNTILVRDGFFDVGHFGIEKGKYNSSQLTRVEWEKVGERLFFGKQINLPFSGYVSPHNAMLLPNGKKLVCNSFQGSLIIGDKEVKLGGWTRGISLSERYIYVGRSSHSYQEVHSLKKVSVNSEVQMGIFKIDWQTMEVTDEFLFSNCEGSISPMGQLYEIRIVNRKDLATSYWSSKEFKKQQN